MHKFFNKYLVFNNTTVKYLTYHNVYLYKLCSLERGCTAGTILYQSVICKANSTHDKITKIE